MSEQQNQAPTTAAANQDKPDISEPNPERQDELRAAYKANVATGKPPYEKVKIRTLGEVHWILRERDWSVDVFLPQGKQWPDLRGANLIDANLRGAVLTSANLRDANLTDADVTDASLTDADVTDANLTGANLSGANLSGSVNLGTARFFGGAALNSDLFSGGANLRGANLTGANLRGANLIEARLDRQTQLAWARLDSKTRLGDIDWQGVPLTRVPAWPARLGDEQDIAEAENRRERITAYRYAARAYRNLSIALRSQGLLIPASNYRLREQVLERKANFLSFNLFGWAFSWLLNLVAGYGERPARGFIAYLLVLFGFASVYFALGSGALGVVGLGVQDQVSTPLAAIVFSVTSFHGRGFFPGGDFRLDDPIIVLAALEAVMGLFIEITFIATFTQRFFGGTHRRLGRRVALRPQPSIATFARSAATASGDASVRSRRTCHRMAGSESSSQSRTIMAPLPPQMRVHPMRVHLSASVSSLSRPISDTHQWWTMASCA